MGPEMNKKPHIIIINNRNGEVIMDKSRHVTVGVKDVAFEHKVGEKAHVHIDLDLMPNNLTGEETMFKVSELIREIGKIEL